MNFRIIISVLLTGAGLMLALMPAPKENTFKLKPEEFQHKMLAEEENSFSVDQVARFVNREDSSIQLIDVRQPEEYKVCNIPGSINIPLSDLLNPDWQGYLDQEKVTNIFYSNGDRDASLAWGITTGLGYKNNSVMKGGLNEWYKTVMLSEFKGESITPRENVLFENRYKARRIFNEMNSLPDSLKNVFLQAKRQEESQIDGGC